MSENKSEVLSHYHTVWKINYISLVKCYFFQAKLCVEGLKLSYDYLCKNEIPFKKVGKLIVATDQKQVIQLDKLYKRALENNCPDIQLVNKESIADYEVECKVRKSYYT